MRNTHTYTHMHNTHTHVQDTHTCTHRNAHTHMYTHKSHVWLFIAESCWLCLKEYVPDVRRVNIRKTCNWIGPVTCPLRQIQSNKLHHYGWCRFHFGVRCLLHNLDKHVNVASKTTDAYTSTCIQTHTHKDTLVHTYTIAYRQTQHNIYFYIHAQV